MAAPALGNAAWNKNNATSQYAMHKALAHLENHATKQSVYSAHVACGETDLS